MESPQMTHREFEIRMEEIATSLDELIVDLIEDGHPPANAKQAVSAILIHMGNSLMRVSGIHPNELLDFEAVAHSHKAENGDYIELPV